MFALVKNYDKATGRPFKKLWYSTLMAIGLIGSLTVSAQDKSKFPTPEQQTVNVYWTDTAPVIDGNMDDACWKNAEVAKDFSLFKFAGLPTQKTEVRILYDAEALYLFWTLHEASMDKLRVGGAEDARDFISFDDAPELFLDPGRSKEKYYQFVATPLGSRFDSSSVAGVHTFTPDWKCVSGRFDAGWTVEQKIPFGELAYAGTLFATPQAGDRWGIQFCRNQGSMHEWSQWVPTSMGFHEPKNFGTAIFSGYKDGKKQPQVAVDVNAADISYGPGALAFTIKSDVKPVEGTCVLSHESKQIIELKEKADPETGMVKFPYHLLDAGNFYFKFSLQAGGKIFYAGKCAVSLPATRMTLETMEKELADGRKTLEKAGDSNPEFVKLRAQLKTFDEKTKEPRAQVARAKELNAAEWRKVIEQTNSLTGDWAKLQFDLNLAGLYRGTASKPEAFALGIATESEKIYRDTRYNGSLTDPVRLSLAGNEAGSFQIIVIPFWQDIKDATVSFTPLTGPDGKIIPAENIRWSRVGYVKLEGIDPKDLAARVYEPDPLMPPAPFAVAAGTVASIWVDLLLPESSPEGIYKGTVTVSANGYQSSRAIEVASYGINIPKKGSLPSDFWFAQYQWNDFYKPLKYTPELHAKHAEVLGRYRISSIPNDWITLCPQVPIFHETDGRFTFDWTTLDKYIATGLKNGSTAFSCALSCNSGWTAWMNNPNVQVIERSTGEKTTLGKFIEGKSQYENPAYRDFLVAYVKHLKELGILDISYYELFDEPNDNSRWLQMIEHHQFFRKVVPELPLQCYGVDPLQMKAGKSAVGLIDRWGPHLTGIDDKMLKAINERREKNGEKFWVYTCGENVDKDGNYSVFVNYNRPYISGRMHLWFSWQYQVDGLLIFALSGVPQANIKVKPEERWPNSDWSDENSRGCGTMIYPGPDYELIPSMRLANIRDGFEDYEFFAELRREAKSLDPAKDAKLIEEVKAALQIDKDIISSFYVWTKDPQRLEAKRAQLVSLIKKVQSAKGTNH